MDLRKWMHMRSKRGIIFDIKKYALHDGPGIRTTVFLKGCPLKCWWCHNPEGINPVPEPIRKIIRSSVSSKTKNDLVGREVTVNEVIAEINKDWIFYEESNGGITFSGGEPLMQPEFLLSLLEECHHIMDASTILDTSGYAPWKVVDSIKDYVDLFLYDIKFIDNIKHQKYTGVSNNQIIKNAEFLDKQNNNVIIRFPVIPGITDTVSNIQQICDWLQDRSTINTIHLLPFHNIAKAKYERLNLDYHLGNLKAPLTEHMDSIAKLFRENGFKAEIGG